MQTIMHSHPQLCIDSLPGHQLLYDKVQVRRSSKEEAHAICLATMFHSWGCISQVLKLEGCKPQKPGPSSRCCMSEIRLSPGPTSLQSLGAGGRRWGARSPLFQRLVATKEASYGEIKLVRVFCLHMSTCLYVFAYTEYPKCTPPTRVPVMFQWGIV